MKITYGQFGQEDTTSDGYVEVIGSSEEPLSPQTVPFHLLFEVERAEYGRSYELTLYIVDSDGYKGSRPDFAAPIAITGDLSRTSSPHTATVNGSIEGILFERAGTYEVQCFVDGQFLATWPLEVRYKSN